MKRTALLSLVVFLGTSIASAQMMSGRTPGHRTGVPGSGGNPMTTGEMLGMGMDLVVAPDGTVLTVERTLPAGATELTESVVAFNSAGGKAWTYRGSGIGRLQVAQSLVLVLKFGALRTGGGGMMALPQKTQLVALNLSNGTQAWSLELDGIAMHIEPAANALYAVVIKPGQQTVDGRNPGGMMQGTRTLVAISNSGVILWQQALGL